MRARGFTELAQMLSKRYRLGDNGISRQQVFQWWKRETKNARGRPFPRGTSVDAPANRPNREFELSEVLSWARPGVPNPHGRKGWRVLGKLSGNGMPRNAKVFTPIRASTGEARIGQSFR